MGTKCEREALAYIKKQLEADCKALETGESASLLAKWLPSVNASNDDVIRQAKHIACALGMNDAQYRKTLSALRAKISIIENNLREKDYAFDYAKQPSKAMLKYRKHTRRGVRKNGHLAAFSIIVDAKDTQIYGINHSRRLVCLFMSFM